MGRDVSPGAPRSARLSIDGRLSRLGSAVRRRLEGVAAGMAAGTARILAGEMADVRALRPGNAPARIFLAAEPLMGDADWRRLLARAPEEAARRAEAAAQAGNAVAQLAFARMLLTGEGARLDPAAGFAMATCAARGGDAAALNLLGRCHELGWGTPANPARAAGFYAAAAAQGDGWAQFNLASLLFDGNGVAQDRGEALVFFLRAARGGNAKAMNMLGRYCEEGWHGRHRPVAAFHWYRRAAEGGDFRGQFNFARLLFGAGRREEALAILTRAIEGGIPSFCRHVGEDLVGCGDPALDALGRRALARGVGPDPAG